MDRKINLSFKVINDIFVSIKEFFVSSFPDYRRFSTCPFLCILETFVLKISNFFVEKAFKKQIQKSFVTFKLLIFRSRLIFIRTFLRVSASAVHPGSYDFFFLFYPVFVTICFLLHCYRAVPLG